MRLSTASVEQAHDASSTVPHACPGGRKNVKPSTARTVVLALALGATSVASAAEPRSNWWQERFDALERVLDSRLTSVRALPTLIEMEEVAPHLEAFANVAARFSRVARDGRAHPEVRAYALKLAATTELSRGRLPRARAHLADLDLMRDGWLIGGFDNEGGGGHTATFGPEEGPIDLRTVWPGKERDVQWRRVEGGAFELAPPIGQLLRPRANTTFYFLSTLESATSGRAILRFGSAGATKVWVNGQQVFADTADHPARFDQTAINIAVRRGANTVLFKVSVLDELPELVARVESTSGRRLAGAEWKAPSKQVVLPALAAVGASKQRIDHSSVQADAVSELARASAQRPSDGELAEDHAIVLAARRAFDTKDRKARHAQERAARLLSKSASAQARLAALHDDDHNEKRMALEQALNVDPRWVPARVALGNYYVERGFTRRGADELARARRDRPDFVPAALGLANALHAMGLDGKARALELEVAETHSRLPVALLAGARANRALGQVAQAIERYRVLLSLRYDDRGARAELASLLLATGDLPGARLELERALELSPSDLGLRLRLASFLSMNEHAREATALYDGLVELAPDEEQVFIARGEHRQRQDDVEGALADFQHALAIKPQNPALRELVRSLQPQENYAGPYLRDVSELAARARAKGVPANGPDAVVLSKLDVVRVYPNGLSSRTRQTITWLVSERSVERARTQSVGYAPGEEEVKIERARIIKKDGSVVESKSENDRRVTDDSSGMYFDHRSRSVTLPNLEMGDVVEFTWRKDDVSATNMFADYFGDVTYLQGTDPVDDADYVLVAPPGREFHANRPALEGVEHTVVAQDDARVWRWRVRDVPRIESEPRMPGWVEQAAYLHVSTFKEWDDVARFWWGLVKEQLHVTPSVAQAAEEAVRGIPASNVEARVRAVYRDVVTKTRYIGLEFGIHGFKPYPVDRVLARRFGDCKDKASLMYAMLEHLGIESRLVLLRMHHLGSLGEKPASLAVFNHAILYVPSLDLWLDGTAEFSGSGELPQSDQAAQVLVVEPGTGKPSPLLTTPVTRSTDNVTAGVYDLVLRGDGSARMQGTTTVRGLSAPGWRQGYQSETGRKERFEQNWARSYPGAKVESLSFSNPRALEEPVKSTFAIELPHLARLEPGSLVFNPLGEDSRYVRTLAPLSTRRYPVDLGPPWRHEFSYRVTLPKGASVLAPSIPAEAATPFGSYSFRAEPSADGTLLVQGHVAIDRARVEPPDYPAFRLFLADLDRAFAQRIRVSRPVPNEAIR